MPLLSVARLISSQAGPAVAGATKALDSECESSRKMLVRARWSSRDL